MANFIKLPNLGLFNLSNDEISTSIGFSVLPNLYDLDLSDNKISEGLEALDHWQKLVALNLSDNQIKDLNNVKTIDMSYTSAKS